LAINYFAFAKKTLNPYIRKVDLIKLLGDKNFYETIDQHIGFLVSAQYKMSDKKKQFWEIGYLIEKAGHYDIGKKESYYYFELNPLYHNALKAIFENRPWGEIPPYVKYPLKMLREYPGREKGLIHLLIKHKGQRRIYAYTIRTLVKKGLRLSEGEIKKGIGYLAKKLDAAYEKIKDDYEWKFAEASWQILEKFNQYHRLELKTNGLKKGVVDKINRIKREFKQLKIPNFTTQDFLNLKIVFIEIKKTGQVEGGKFSSTVKKLRETPALKR
jgi:hypothetical protein